MNKLNIERSTTYTLTGLTAVDLDVIGLGLDKVSSITTDKTLLAVRDKLVAVMDEEYYEFNRR